MTISNEVIPKTKSPALPVARPFSPRPPSAGADEPEIVNAFATRSSSAPVALQNNNSRPVSPRDVSDCVQSAINEVKNTEFTLNIRGDMLRILRDIEAQVEPQVDQDTLSGLTGIRTACEDLNQILRRTPRLSDLSRATEALLAQIDLCSTEEEDSKDRMAAARQAAQGLKAYLLPPTAKLNSGYFGKTTTVCLAPAFTPSLPMPADAASSGFFRSISQTREQVVSQETADQDKSATTNEPKPSWGFCRSICSID